MATALGLLVEPATTNLITQSQDMTQAVWTKLGCSTGTAIQAPDNSTTAIPITVTATPFPSLRETFSVTAGKPYSFSGFFKRISGDSFVDFELNDTAAGQATTYVNLTTGAYAQVNQTNWTANSTAINQILNSWFDINNTFTPSFSSANVWFNMYQSAVTLPGGTVAGAASTVGSVMSNWGLQLEQNTVPTSYFPTTSGSATRATDVLQLTVPNNTYDVLVEDTTGSAFMTTTVVTGFLNVNPRAGSTHITRVRVWPQSGAGSLTTAQKSALAPGASALRVWRPTGTVINVTTASAIQTVISGAGSGSVIVFANGTYNLNGINLKTGVSLMAANQFGARLQGNASGNVLQGSGLSDITIWGFVIDEGGIGPDLKGSIWFDNHSTRINIIGNHFQGYSKPASGGAASAIFLFNPDNFFIQANLFGTSTAVLDYQPISIHSTDATTPAGPLVISDNTFQGFARFGCETLCTVQVMNIDRNIFGNANTGSFLLSIADVNGQKTQNGTVYGNVFNGGSLANLWGIELAQGLTVSGNILTGCPQGIVIAGTVNGTPPNGTKAVVQGNIINGSTNAFSQDGGYNGGLEWLSTNIVNGTAVVSSIGDPNGVGGHPPGLYTGPVPPLFQPSIAPTP